MRNITWLWLGSQTSLFWPTLVLFIDWTEGWLKDERDFHAVLPLPWVRALCFPGLQCRTLQPKRLTQYWHQWPLTVKLSRYLADFHFNSHAVTVYVTKTVLCRSSVCFKWTVSLTETYEPFPTVYTSLDHRGSVRAWYSLHRPFDILHLVILGRSSNTLDLYGVFGFLFTFTEHYLSFYKLCYHFICSFVPEDS